MGISTDCVEMDKAWVFAEICAAYEKNAPITLYDLESMSPHQPERHPYSGLHAEDHEWRLKGPIYREVQYLIKWGLVEKRQTRVGARQKDPILPTELGLRAWNKIVKPIFQDRPWDRNAMYELHYTNKARVTELRPISVLPPEFEVQLDPVLEPIFPAIREMLEEVRDRRPWLYSLATGKLIDVIRLRLIARVQQIMGLYHTMGRTKEL